MPKKLILTIILLILAFGLVACAPQRGAAASASQPPVKVFYTGSKSEANSVPKALGLAQTSGAIELVDTPQSADVIFLNGQIPGGMEIPARIKDGAGLVLILGKEVTEEQVSSLLGQNVTLNRKENALSLVPVAESSNGLLQDIVWGSAPQIRERIELAGLKAEAIINGYEDSETVLSTYSLGKGQAYILSSYLDDTNPQIQEWPYFNYLIYNLVERSAGKAPASFGDYAPSPVPHPREQITLAIILFLLLVTSFVIFYFVRRYSKAHPEAINLMVSSKEKFEKHEAGSDWEEIGFHRPVAGFLFAMMMGLLLFIPLIIYQNLILPTFILPSAQALGLWGRVVQVLGLAWTLFDMGTSVAFIKFFSQYRVHDPRRAVQYGQVFVWWQALSGAFQVALVVIVAGTFLPKTSYAIYTWLIIAHTFIQIPGFYAVMRHALYAQQRLDYAQILDNCIMLVWPMITQPIFVLLMLAWGRSTPTMGIAMGGAIGLGMAAYVVELMNFALGYWLYQHLGYNARVFFLAHFDWSVIKEAFRFGALDMGGSLVYAAGQAVEVLITQTRLVNYSEVWGNWMMAQNFVFAYSVLVNLTDGVMPGISEAISHGRRKLSQYYAAMTYKWSATIAAFIGAVLLAVADRFIIGSSGAEFSRAAIYVIPLIFWGGVQHLGTIGDTVAVGSNRPGLKMLMIAAEQTLRISLAVLLVGRLQVTGLVVAYFIAVMTRGIVVYFINSRVCFPLRYFPYQSLVAPLLAGTVHYFILRYITGLIWQGDPVTSILIFLIGILFSFPLFTFFYGLFGGWDDATLDELKRAVDMQPFLRFMGWLFWKGTALGASISPLHNRFPITIRKEALLEAQSLTLEKVNLENLS